MTRADLISRTLARVGEDPAAPSFYTQAQAVAALDLAQRLFVLMTLCLESTRELVLTPGVRFYRMLGYFSDWIAPLRVRLSTDPDPGTDATFDTQTGDGAKFNDQAAAPAPPPVSPKLRPATFYELSARRVNWLLDTGMPSRYGALGADLLFVDRTIPAAGAKLLVTYARGPVPMAVDDQEPEIPAADHPALIDGAAVILRLAEGGQELRKATSELFPRYMEVAKLRASQVRARSLAERYDVLPFEMARFDLSRVLRIRADLPPYRKEIQWPTSQG